MKHPKIDIAPTTVDALIVNYQTANQLSSFLPTLIESLGQCKYKILINNNDTSENDLCAAHSNGTTIHVFQSKNIGFGSAINNLAGKSEAEYILIANPDCKIHAGYIADLMNEYKRIEKTEKIGFLGAQLLNEDLTPDISWGEFPTILEVFFRTFFLHKILPDFYETKLSIGKKLIREETCAVPYPSGAFLLIRRNTFLKYKGFDRRFFAYFEETDLSQKLLSDGYKSFITPYFKVIHQRGNKGISKVNNKLYIQSQYIYFKKHQKSVYALIILNIFSIFLRIPIVGFKNSLIQLIRHYHGFKNAH